MPFVDAPTTAPAMYPLPYVVASWLGYPMARIVEGLRAGTIAPPVGSPADWMPPGYEGEPPHGDADDSAPADDAQPPGADGVDDPHPAAPGDDVAPPPDGEAVDPGADVVDPAPGQPVRDAWLAVAQAIDPTIDDTRFGAWWDGNGGDDDARAARMADVLWRTRFGEARPADVDPMLARDRLVEAIDAGGTTGTLVALDALGSAELARLAREDPGILAALEAFDTHAFAALDGDHGAAGRFDPVTGEERLSDAWIDDRARLLAWRLVADGGTDLASIEGDSWRFVDRSGAAEETLVLGDDGTVEQQVVFARDGGDRIAGLEGTDRLHGGDGDDVLGGGAGDDLVEGADGDDRLNGGRGDDALAGGRGDDDLGGGRGRDRLEGGAGDDLLDGGRGGDRLEGGAGHDTYEFARGDGDDVVVDADGRGEIVLDGVRLTGAEQGEGAPIYERVDDGAGGTTLVIRGEGEDGANTIRIAAWTPGDLGIELDESSFAPAVDAAADEDDDTDAPPSARVRMQDRIESSRETGNESGMGVIAATDDAAEDAAAPAPVTDTNDEDDGMLAFADWTDAQVDAAMPPVPPEVPADAVALTAADLASALGDLAPDGDDADAAPASTALPAFGAEFDWSRPWIPAPPEVAGRASP
jgi:hypothetical protein